jgi:hypothetical protein
VTKSLDEVRTKLYRAFDLAWQQYENVDQSSGSVAEKVSARSLALTAASQSAQALTSVEHEIAVQKAYADWKANGEGIDDDIAGGIIRDVKTMAKLKIKPPGA